MAAQPPHQPTAGSHQPAAGATSGTASPAQRFPASGSAAPAASAAPQSAQPVQSGLASQQPFRPLNVKDALRSVAAGRQHRRARPSTELTPIRFHYLYSYLDRVKVTFNDQAEGEFD